MAECRVSVMNCGYFSTVYIMVKQMVADTVTLIQRLWLTAPPSESIDVKKFIVMGLNG